jgi:hypothetical protein
MALKSFYLTLKNFRLALKNIQQALKNFTPTLMQHFRALSKEKWDPGQGRKALKCFLT